jgi:predicted MPP superfamily phosphohydrolase
MIGIICVQVILLLAHWFIYHTWVAFWGNSGPYADLALRAALLVLAFSFTVATLLGFRFSGVLVATIYKLAAVWLGLLNFFFLAACFSWLVWFALRLSPLAPGLPAHRPLIAAVLFALALVTGIYGLINASWIRIRHVAVKLPDLPESWRGRTALLLSDLHLGNINGLKFSSRIAATSARLHPDIVFLAGDIFDGSGADPDRLAAPLLQIAPPFGFYFTSGNHEEYGGEARYTDALTRAGIHVLANERVTVDGLRIVGVSYSESNYPIRLRTFLQSLDLADGPASILLNHAPNRLSIVEQTGVSLQLSGHTHGGQFFPFTWITRRTFGKFTYGLQQFGSLQVYTSSGAGTWGPPMRVGTHPEIVLLHFDSTISC